MSMTVKDLRQMLVDQLGYSQENAEKLGKGEIKELLSSKQTAEQLFDSVEVIKEKEQEPIKAELVNPEEANKVTIPDMTDPEWTDYVLSLITDKEKINGSPKTDALRRIAVKLLGHFDSVTNVVQSPEVDGRATVLVELHFPNGDMYGNKRIICGAADVCFANTLREFAIHPVATAETRAEGRALRKALLLTKVLAAEEAMGPVTNEPDGSDGKIVSGMLNSLHLMCNRQSIDLGRLAQHKFQVQNLEDLTITQGRDLADELSKYQRKAIEIPEEIKA